MITTKEEEKQLFLQMLQSQIQKEEDVKSYLLRSYFSTLSKQKPQLEIIRYISGQSLDKKENESANQVNRKRVYRSAKQYLEFEVYDHMHKINKFIQVYLLKTCYGEVKTQLIKQIKTIEKLARSDLILKPLDYYCLKSDLTYYNEPDDFFVVEFEMFDLSYIEFCQTYNTSLQDEINQVILKQSHICYENSFLQIEESNINKIVNSFYVFFQDSGKILLKMNMVTLPKNQSVFKSDDQNDQKDQEQSILASKNILKKRNKFSPLRQNYSQEFLQNINAQIDSEKLVSKLSELLEDKFDWHDPNIFKVIQQHPKYSRFDLVMLDSEQFLFKVTTVENTFCCFLEGKKYQSLREAEQQNKQYESLLSDSSIKTSITNSELIVLEKTFYILLERRTVEKQLNGQSLVLSEKMKNSFHSDLSRDNVILSYLIELAYNLFMNHGINICSVNYESIIIIVTDDSHQNYSSHCYGLLIQDFNEGNFRDSLLNEIFWTLLNNIECFKKISSQVLQMVTDFIDHISSNDKDNVKQLFSRIQQVLEQMKNILDLKHSHNIFYMTPSIQFTDISLQLLDIRGGSFNHQNISAIMNDLINKYQLNAFCLSYGLGNSIDQLFQLSLQNQSNGLPCCKFEEQIYKELLILQNQRQLKDISLFLDISQYCCGRICSSLQEFKQLQNFSIQMYRSSQNQEDQRNSRQIMENIATVLNQLQQFNHITIHVDKSHKIAKEYVQLFKINRLVRISITYMTSGKRTKH